MYLGDTPRSPAKGALPLWTPLYQHPARATLSPMKLLTLRTARHIIHCVAMLIGGCGAGPSRSLPGVVWKKGNAMPTIIEDYIQNHPGSAKLYQEAKGLFPGGVTHDTRYASPFPIYVTHGEGALKWDVDGNEYVDYVCGHGSLILGHSHPAIVAAVEAQMARGTHLGASTEQEVRWAKAIKALMPSVEKMRFHSSGTEATMMALRLARAYTGKSKIIKFQDHFHGWHDYVMVGSDRSAPGIPESTRQSMVVLPPGDLNAVDRAMAQDDIAAVILEPTGAHFGQLPLDLPDFLVGLRELTERHGVLLIMDEVVTGFRIHPGGAQTLYGVSPDLTSMAKIVAGGLPGGVVAGKAEIIDQMAFRDDADWDSRHRVYHPGTFNANPLSAAAGTTCLEMVATQGINAMASAVAEKLKAGLNDVLAKNEVAGHAHSKASIVHLVLKDCDCDRHTCTMPHEEIKEAVASPVVTLLKRALQNGGVDMMGRDAFLVSAVHRGEDIDRTLGAFEASLAALRREGAI